MAAARDDPQPPKMVFDTRSLIRLPFTIKTPLRHLSLSLPNRIAEFFRDRERV
jgi:hypothetical protein